MENHEISAGNKLEWDLFCDYVNLLQASNSDSELTFDDRFYYNLDKWLQDNYKIINWPSRDRVFRFKCLNDKIEFMFRWL
jgi:hypothetical protein